MLDDLLKERLNKRKLLEEGGYNVYPSSAKRTHQLGGVISNFNSLARSKNKLFVVGRIMSLRKHGAISFIDLKDESGNLQIFLKKDDLKDYLLFRENIDIGDFAEISGTVFKTKAGEKTIAAKTIRIITKSLRPLPSVWYGLQDVEERYRKRYLDLIFNPEIKKVLEFRSKLIQEMRSYLYDSGFLEVETPVLQPLPGGASAKPFVTHLNALDEDFYLRVAPELYLKRLLVGGFEKIFEIGKNFRNEGIDREHNPEFTALELYWTYQDYRGLMKFTESWIKSVIKKVGLKKHPLLKKWKVVTFETIFKEHAKKDYANISPEELDETFKKIVRPQIIEPTYVIDYPEVVMPLAKLKSDNPKLTESFQLIYNKSEIIKGFSEMNDPKVQREQMMRQEDAVRTGNQEASRLDEEFLEALEYGMPTAAGLGIGIDRLVAFLTNVHGIKDAMYFTLIKRKDQ